MANNKHDPLIGASLKLETVSSGIVSEKALVSPGQRGRPPPELFPLYFKHHDPAPLVGCTSTPEGDFSSLSPDAADLVYPIRSVVSISQPLQLTPGSPNTFWGSNNSSVGSITGKAPAKVCIGPEVRRSRSNSPKNVPGLGQASAASPGMTSDSRLGRSASVVGVSSEGDMIGGSGTKLGGKNQLLRDHPGESYMTTRFEHKMTGDGHCVITGVSGSENMQRCEDEPIHIPGAVQGFGVLIALKEDADGKLGVKIVSEVGSNLNSRKIYRELYADH